MRGNGTFPFMSFKVVGDGRLELPTSTLSVLRIALFVSSRKRDSAS